MTPMFTRFKSTGADEPENPFEVTARMPIKKKIANPIIQ
jgi:hypothetical protein